MTAPIDIEVDDAWFEGHFPGRPILPGVAQLALVFEALAKVQGRPLPVSGIAFARMRQQVVPGDRLQLTASMRPDGTIRFALTRAGEAVTNGELRTTPVEGKALPRIATSGRTLERPSPAALLPHRPPMRFVTAVLDDSDEHFTTEATVPPACRLSAGPGVPAVAAIEAAAQTAALREAIRGAAAQPSSRPRMGYLVGLRDVNLHMPRIPAGVPFVVSVRFEAATPPLAHYGMQVELEGKPVLDGTLATWLTDETLPE
jgi:3-hydroxymyristoyl/3-hydroxydecanoyl-(acyl carrier protein) dehydratase